MQAAFIITLNTEGDTDLIGVAEQLKFMVEDRYEVVSCHPWSRDTLPQQPQTAVPSTETKTTPK